MKRYHYVFFIISIILLDGFFNFSYCQTKVSKNRHSKAGKLATAPRDTNIIHSPMKSIDYFESDSLNSPLSIDTIVNSNFNFKLNYLGTSDTLFFKNGDKLTGKILSFQQGRLTFDADGPGQISVKWYKILSISGGSRIYKVENLNGSIYIGHLTYSINSGEVNIVESIIIPVKFSEIIRIFPIEEKWFKGFKGNVGGGASYSKSSEVLRANAEYNLQYIISRWTFESGFSYINTQTNGNDPSIRINLNLQELYELPNRWVLAEMNAFNRNDELGIKSRISFILGVGNSLVQTERQKLLVLTGLAQNYERPVESNNVLVTLEWPISLQHSIYSFALPNLSTTTAITSYVGVTERDRFRLDASSDITWEFIPDFKLKLSVYYNFDNKILQGKKSTKDYGANISLLLELK